MRCSTYLQMSCNRKLWNARVNSNVKIGLQRVTAHAKNIKSGKLSVSKNSISSDEKRKKTYISENRTCSEEKEGTSHKYCLRCGRKLTNAENQILGYGPVCYAKIQREQMPKKLF